MERLDRVLVFPKHKTEFLNDNERFYCLICEGLLRQPKQLPCGHCVCGECIRTLYDEQGNGHCPLSKSTDCHTFTESEVHDDYGLRRDILESKVNCPHKRDGCLHVGQLKRIEKHLDSDCECRKVDCSFKDRGCLDKIMYKDLQGHISSHCLYAPISCAFCQMLVPRCNMKAHHDDTCDKILLSCQHGCGIYRMARNEMRIHIEECLNRMIPCQYSFIGCDFLGRASEHNNHEEACSHKHLRLSLEVVKDLMENKTKTDRKIQELEMTNKELQDLTRHLTKDMKSIKANFGMNDKDVFPRSHSVPTFADTQPTYSMASLSVPRTKPAKQRSRNNSYSSSQGT